MADKSAIEWTDATWNPIVGCSILTPGCTHCYAMGMAARIEAMTKALQAKGQTGAPHYNGTTRKVNGTAVWTGKLAMAPEHILTEPLTWRAPRRIFVNSMGDLFHEDVPNAWIDKVFAIMALAPQHTFQVLTKRAKRMRDYLARLEVLVSRRREFLVAYRAAGGSDELWLPPWPLANVWLGVSAERQQEADQRIPELLATPAAVRFVSAEPLLGPISFRWAKWQPWKREGVTDEHDGLRRLDWIIVGGESGRDSRPMVLGWAKEIVRQCSSAGVAVFVKQIGANPTNREGLPHPAKNKKGGDWSEWPEALRVREFPNSAMPEAR